VYDPHPFTRAWFLARSNMLLGQLKFIFSPQWWVTSLASKRIFDSQIFDSPMCNCECLLFALIWPPKLTLTFNIFESKPLPLDLLVWHCLDPWNIWHFNLTKHVIIMWHILITFANLPKNDSNLSDWLFNLLFKIVTLALQQWKRTLF
jgi:hypothetical protein